MKPELLVRLGRNVAGQTSDVPPGTAGTHGTALLPQAKPPGTQAGTLGTFKRRKVPLFQVFQVFQVFQPEHDEFATAERAHFATNTRAREGEHDEFTVAERAAIAVVDAGVPDAYADGWAAFQVRRLNHLSPEAWYRAVDDAGRFLDEWAGLALDLGWQSVDIFGRDGLAEFCQGEAIRALGPEHAITVSERIFARQRPGAA